MIEKIFAADGLERLRIIEGLTIEERDEICELFKNCALCPMAVIYADRPFCADVSPHFRIKTLLYKGGKFTSREEKENV